jgi:hypothetical protein
MLRSFRTLALAALASTIATPAFAVTFVGDYAITSNTGHGLIVNTTKVGDLTSGFTLNNVGDTFRYGTLFKIWTPEADVGSDDLKTRPISVAFNFTSPNGISGGSVTGDTVGEVQFWGLKQNGLLGWSNDGIQTFSFGNGGSLQVELDNWLEFGNGFLGLTDKQRTVGATFTLLSNSTPGAGAGAVPEPATWAMMIAGFGMIGGAMRSRRGKTSVSFA